MGHTSYFSYFVDPKPSKVLTPLGVHVAQKTLDSMGKTRMEVTLKDVMSDINRKLGTMTCYYPIILNQHIEPLSLVTSFFPRTHVMQN